MKQSDWIASTRDGRLAMAKSWKLRINYSPGWNIPADTVSKLSTAIDVAEVALKIPAGERNPVSNAKLKDAFDELTAVMRDIKKRYFFAPPLENADFAALDLRIKDTEPTAVAKPLGEAEADIEYLGKRVMQLHIKHIEGTPTDDKADYGYKIYFGIYSDSDTQPASGEDLTKSKFTRRKKQLFEFTPADSKKTAYFCIRYENSKGETGPWGPMFSALIP